MSQTADNLLKKVISHAKEYGYVFPSSEIYDGLSATYDYGQYGVELKNHLKQYWWHAMVRMNENIVGIAEIEITPGLNLERSSIIDPTHTINTMIVLEAEKATGIEVEVATVNTTMTLTIVILAIDLVIGLGISH